MAKTILSNKKSSHGSPYAYYSLSVEEVGRTPSEVTLKFTATGYLQYETSYIGTGKGYGLDVAVCIDDKWYEWTLKSESSTWNGRTKHSRSKTITVSASASKSSLRPYVRVRRSVTSNHAASLDKTQCESFGITKVSDKYENVKLKGSVDSQTTVVAELTGLPKSVGYKRTVKWYLNGERITTIYVAKDSITTSLSRQFKGLVPSTVYTVKAVIGCDDDTVLLTKSISLKTAAETGALVLKPYSTYIGVEVQDMYHAPNYDRRIKVYFREAGSNDYSLHETIASQKSKATSKITGLKSNQKYDVKVQIYNGSKNLLELSGSVTTPADSSMIPTGIINGIRQKFGKTPCEVTIDWTADKLVAGTVYEIEAKAVEGTQWKSIGKYDNVTSPVTLDVEFSNKEVLFRIVSKNEALVKNEKNISEEFSFYVRREFYWTFAKVQGDFFVIKAEEWNRLAEYAEARNEDKGISISIPIVSPGDDFTAEIYNDMKRYISNVVPVSVADKKRGDAITADDIDALRIAINTDV